MLAKTRPEASQGQMRTCANCPVLFVPVRPGQAFCCDRCRHQFHVDHGVEGQVVSVRRINKGASIVVHLSGPAAEQAMRLELREVVRLVVQP